VTAATASLALALPAAIVRRDVPLASLGRWRIGGPADLVIEPRDEEELAGCLVRLHRSGVPYIIVGDGSNLLFDYAGLRGAVVKVGRHFRGLSFGEDGLVTAGAGHWVPCFVRAVMARGLSGCVHATGIPGTLGGLVAMNGGSQRKGIGEQLVRAWAIRPETGELVEYDHAAMGFAYRTSAVQDGAAIITRALFRYTPADAEALHAEALKILGDRRRKFPRNRANCGSVFVSDPALYHLIGPPGMAIEKVGLKGTRLGGAQLSPEHANFIVNCGGASSADVLGLIALARRTVEAHYGVAMLEEVRHVLPDGRMRPAHISADEMIVAQSPVPPHGGTLGVVPLGQGAGQ
jgi:UDP-N-acetylmuramate dehydrogenase